METVLIGGFQISLAYWACCVPPDLTIFLRSVIILKDVCYLLPVKNQIHFSICKLLDNLAHQ